MTFEEWYEKDKKKKKQVTSKDTSFEEWHSSRFPVSVSAEQEEEDAKKREAYLAKSKDKDIAPVRDTLTIETTQDIYDKYGKYFYESDFADLSKPTGSKINDVGWKFWEDQGDYLYDFINDIDNQRELIKAVSGGTGQHQEYGNYTGYECMTQFETSIYNYLYASKGKDEAQKFLDDLKPALTYRRGAYDAENIRGIENDALRTITYVAKSIGGGIDSATTGLRNWLSEEDVPTTAMEVTNALLSEDLDGWKKNLYGAGNVVGNQLLFLPFSAANPAVGLALQGASAGGNAYRQALQEGKTKEEARAYGAMVGSLEFLTGKLLGGVAGMTGNLPSKALSKVSTFSNSLLRVGAKYGISLASEVTEEELQLWLEPAVRSIAFGEDYDAPELEEMAETAIVTMISTGVLNSSTDIATGQFTKVNGLSVNEAKVIEAEVNNRVAEAEADGKKLTGKEKEKIRDAVVKEAQRGYISTDTIESVLGGKSYENYKNLAEQENTLKSKKTELENEIKELVKTPEQQFTIEQRERLDSLREEARGIKEQIKGLDTKTAKTNLFNEVDKLTSKDTLLRESYNEIIRKTQDIDIDENQYNGTKFADAAKKTIENARKANANNSNRVRDFVEFSARYSSQSGVVVDFRNENQIKQILENQLKSDIAKETDEAKLAELQDTLKQVQEGKIKVNGVKTKNGVAINLESPNYLNAVLGHEVTHFLEGTGDAYKKLQEIAFRLAKQKGDYEGRRKIVEILYKNVEGTTVDQELTADLIGDYLFTEYDFIKSLSTENRNVFQKVYDKIKHMFKLATAGSKEARELEKLMHQFEKALRESVETSQNAEHNEAATQFSFSSVANTFHGDPDMPSMAFEKTDYKQTDGYKNYVEQCINNMRQTRTDFDESVARREIEEQIDGIVRVALAAKKAGYDIYDDATKRSKKDSKKRLLFSSLEPNSDYFTSSDISTECDKRKNFADIYDAIVRKEEAMGVPQGKRFFDNVDNYFYLHKVLADKGLTQPCRECYVESMRKNLAPMANAFLRLVNETDVNNKANDQLYHQDGKLKSNNGKLRNKVLKAFEANPEYNMTASDLTVEMLTTADGLAQLKIQAPLIYEAFNSFYGQSKPKMPKAATPFRFGELTALLTDHNGKINRKLVEKINSTGGFRLQSYSDFQIENFTDVLQVIYEAGTLGLSGHAYTKVPAFLKATEGTNLKRNISIFMYKDGDEWKLDKNDSFPYELEEIYDIVNSDASGNTGIIAVSQNKDMSCWIMANDFIGYGIPFHKSGLKMDTVRDTDVQTDDGRIVKGYSETIDHTKQQTEVYADTETKVKKGINIYSFWDFNNVDNLSQNELIEKNVREYIKRCEIAGYLPKFRDYVINNDSVLNDVLRYAKELGFVEQTATIDDISFKYEGKYHSYTIPYGYYKFLGDFNMFKPDGTASPHDTLSLNGYDFDAAERFFADAEGVRRNEILQQFANGEERQKYRDSDMDAEELTKIVKQKREEVVDSIVAPTEAQYSLSNAGENRKLGGSYRFDGKDFTVKSDIAPVREDIAPDTPTAENVTAEEIPMPTDADAPPIPDEILPMTEEEANAIQDEKVNAHSATSLEAIQTELANVKELRSESFASFEQKIANKQAEYNAKKNKDTKTANNLRMQIERLKRLRDSTDSDYAKRISTLETREKLVQEGKPTTRQEHYNNIMNDVKATFSSVGFDFDDVLEKAKNLSTFSTVDNTPQRVMEKTLGYKEGQVLSDLTVNKVAQNETEGIKWLNSITNRKTGLLAQLSKQYNIKPESKEIEAAQMYAEGSWVDEETGDEFAYGDAELAKDFPDAEVQNNIKALVRDPRIRQFYDETLDAINEARKRNGYPEIPRRNNYYLHYRELGDFFTKNGLPFNPNDIRAKDLPTDMVGRTADLKPGQPYFTSSMQRKGKKTSYDLYKGIELYANMAKNQIYHIDDIQTLRALHYYLAERFGQAQGLENLDRLDPDQASEQIKKVFGSHLSTFAAFLDTEANILAGKTSMIDRAFSEGLLGRRILTFADSLNKQTGAGMVGYSVSSPFTNLLPVVREFAKSNPVDSLKALTQTVANIASKGKFDSFREDSSVYIRRKGADRFNRTLWQKLQDPGYALMSAVDEIGTEIIARTEYNKAIRKGMSEKEAHYEADKKTSRLMADRSLGQMPQMYTSRLLGLVTKFQLEVRNDLDSMFYDTLQEKKLANKDIENALAKNAKTAAQVAWTYGVTAIALHAFGQAFEKVAGYNPAFDIVEAISKAFGWDDDEESEDTLRDNLGQGAMSLLEDLPYASIFLDGGRVPISSALPDFKGIITGKDEYGNEKSLADSFIEIAPYMLPAGGNQLKKTVQGLGMFSDDHPVAGSYTDSGNLRFPVEDTPLNRLQAGLFGQYASKNAREYFDNDYAPLKEKQIQEYIDVDMPIKDYWEYRKGLSDLAPLPGNESVTLNQKGDYIGSLDLPVSKKNILINNIADRSKPIDFTGYENYSDFEEFDFATRFPEKYAVLKEQGISVADYKANYEETAFLYTDDFSWAANNPEKYTLSKAVTNDVEEYKRYTTELYNIEPDKDSNGKSISGSRKEKVLDYINNLDLDYGAKLILFKSEFPSDKTYNYDIINYVNSRSDLTYEDRVTIYRELGFKVTSDGGIYAE